METLHFLHGQESPVCIAAVDKHFDGYFTLQYSPDCDLELAYDGVWQSLQGCWFWTAYPGPRIRFHNTPGTVRWHHFYIAFNGPQVAMWQKEGLFPFPPQPSQSGYEEPFRELYAAVRRDTIWSRKLAVNLLERILIELADQRLAPIIEEKWLDTALAYLEEPTLYEPDYDSLAQKCGMALSTLRRKFKEATGTSMHQFLVQTRIAEARDLLIRTDMPIKEIADSLGYRDVFFFTRQFKEQVKMPPAEYRRTRLH